MEICTEEVETIIEVKFKPFIVESVPIHFA